MLISIIGPLIVQDREAKLTLKLLASPLVERKLLSARITHLIVDRAHSNWWVSAKELATRVLSAPVLSKVIQELLQKVKEYDKRLKLFLFETEFIGRGSWELIAR